MNFQQWNISLGGVGRIKLFKAHMTAVARVSNEFFASCTIESTNYKLAIYLTHFIYFIIADYKTLRIFVIGKLVIKGSNINRANGYLGNIVDNSYCTRVGLESIYIYATM